MICPEKNEQEKRKSIITNIHENVFVEAGAGAGKTGLVIQRVVNQIKSGAYKADEIAIITFTNKATEELYSRVGKEFRRQLREEELSKDETKYLTEALQKLENMQISTIHGFCYRILKEHAFEAMIPLDVTLLDDIEKKKWLEDIFSDWFRWFTQDECFKDACLNVQKYLGVYNYEADLMGAYLEICELPEEIEIAYDKSLLSISYDDFLTEVNKEIIAFETEVVKLVNTELEKSYPQIDDIYLSDAVKKNANTLVDKSDVKKAKDILSIVQAGLYKLSRKKEEKESIDCLNQKIFDKSKKLSNILKKYDAICYANLMHYAKEAKTYFWQNCGSRYLTNDMLLQKARALACEDTHVHEQLCNQFKCIYVDEFQDVDKVQVDLIMSIAKKDLAGKELRPGALFVVGDPKQSIYRFRGAELAIFHEIKKRMLEDADKSVKVYELDNNYRSDKKVIDWINQYFKSKIPDYRDMTYPFPEGSSNTTNNKIISGVYRYKDDDKLAGKRDEALSMDAKHLSEMLKFLVDNHYQMQNINQDGQVSYSDITYGDFLILCGNTKKMDYYVKALAECGIPVKVDGKYSVSENMVLKHFQLVFQYLVSPHYKLYREGALQTIAQSLVSEENHQEAEACLEYHRSKVQKMNSYGIAGYLLRHMELLLPRERQLKNEEIRSCQAKLEQMVESVLASTNGSAEEMIQAISAYLQRKVTHELLLEGTENAVTFMNTHKAKGLEGNIVIVADRREQVYDSDGMVRYREVKDKLVKYSYYTHFSRKDEEGNREEYARTYLGYLPGSDISIYGRQQARDEWMRLRYVTATRAKHALIFMDRIIDDCAFSDAELERQPSICKIMEECKQSNQESTGETSESDAGKKFEPNETAYEAKQCVAQYECLSPSSLEHSEKEDKQSDAKQSTQSTDDATAPDERNIAMDSDAVNAEILDEDEEEEVEVSDIEKELAKKRPKGKVFGTIMHRCFELLVRVWDGSSVVEAAKINQIIVLALMENQQDMKRRYGNLYEEAIDCYKAFLTEVLQTFMENPEILAFIQNADSVYTEYPFSFFVNQEQDADLFDEIAPWYSTKEGTTKVWINGTADFVLHMKDGRIVIIDYKSDRKREEWSDADLDAHLNMYRGQLTLYRHAMAKLFDVPIDKVESYLYPIEKAVFVKK